MSVTKTLYEIPYPNIEAMSDLSDIAVYVNQLATFVAEKVGLVVRSDLAVTSPDYAPYSHIEFLAPAANEFPVICVMNTNVNNSAYQPRAYGIGVCTYSGGVHRPAENMTYSGTSEAVNIAGNTNIAICFSSYNYPGHKFYLQVLDFSDGRKMFLVKAYTISSGNIDFDDNISCFIKTPVIVNGNSVDTWLYFSFAKPNISYLEDYEQPTYSNGTFNTYGFSQINLTTIYYTFGLIPNRGKEFVMDYDMWISDNVIFPNVAIISDNEHAWPGRSIVMGNKEYIVIALWKNTYSSYAIPVEVG